MAEIWKFIFRHDQWLEERATQEFVNMVDYLAWHNRIESIPAIDQMKERAPEIVRDGTQHLYYAGLDVGALVSVSDDGARVSIHEAWFGRVIPIDELFDWVMHHRGHVTTIVVNPAGMSVGTSCGSTVRVPGCGIYLGRMAEDGLRYLNACFMIDHCTGGAVKLSPQDLVGQTEHITVDFVGRKWVVDTGLPVHP